MRHSRSNSRDIRATCQHEIMPAEKHDQRTPPRKTEKERERERERGRESRELTHSLFSSYSTANSASSLSRCLSVSLARRSTIRIDLRERANNRRKRHSEDRHRRSTVLVVLVTADSRWHVRTIAPPGLRVRSHMRARACARARPNRGSAVRMRLFEIEHTSEGSTFPRGNEHVASTRETDPYLLLPPLLFRDWFDPWCLSLTHSLSLSLPLSFSFLLLRLPLTLSHSCWRSLETLGDPAIYGLFECIRPPRLLTAAFGSRALRARTRHGSEHARARATGKQSANEEPGTIWARGTHTRAKRNSAPRARAPDYLHSLLTRLESSDRPSDRPLRRVRARLHFTPLRREVRGEMKRRRQDPWAALSRCMHCKHQSLCLSLPLSTETCPFTGSGIPHAALCCRPSRYARAARARKSLLEICNSRDD